MPGHERLISAGERQDDHGDEVRVPLQPQGLEGRARVRGHLPSGRVRPAEAERHQGQRDPPTRTPYGTVAGANISQQDRARKVCLSIVQLLVSGSMCDHIRMRSTDLVERFR